jgi:transposase
VQVRPRSANWTETPASGRTCCLEGEIEIEYLPAYAPELNPVEYLWGHWKHHELPNVCPRDLWQLGEGARRTLRRLRRRPTLITAFWKQASLFE